MFELLFNYPMSIWHDATLVFDSGWPLLALIVAIVLAIVLIFVSLLRCSLEVPRRAVIALLQCTAAAVVLIMLWQPALLVAVSERGENTVAWVVDTSMSMSREDAQDSSLASAPLSRLSAAATIVERFAMDDKTEYAASIYRIGNKLTRVDGLDKLLESVPGQRSRLVTGLDTLLGTVNETALAAVVLLSDGADNSDVIDPQWWQSLAAAGVPVHTVGLGQISDPDDLELVDVVLPSQAQPDVPINARLRIKHSQGGIARIRVMAANQLLAAEDIQLPDDVGQSEHSIRFSSGSEGVRQLEFIVELHVNSANPAAGLDPFPANNRQPRVIQVIDAPKRILYVEGEPRWEYKFLRRALDAHPGIEVVSLLRTSPNKFYRQGVKDADELADGFPNTREQLFSYDAVIIGSFDAAELSTPQQSALRDFVSERGGSLLMLAGRHGLSDGGWGRSVVASALPVVLSSRLTSNTFNRQRGQALPTLTGLRTDWLQLADTEAANLAAWQGLPALADAQTVGRPKPGAITLLRHRLEDSSARGSVPLLVMQRYGRGRSAVLGTSGTWRWQMGLPSEDQRHEQFWRQLLGMLVEQSVPRLSIETGSPVYRDADIAHISINAYNADYTNVQQSYLPITLTQPDGSSRTLELTADNQRPGLYVGDVAIATDGPYSLSATLPSSDESSSGDAVTAEQWWVAESGNAEFFNAQLQSGFLQRIAETTGGSYMTLDSIDQIDTVLSKENAALKRELRLPLWNMPFFFLCLLLAKGLEWLLRLRWKRL